MRCERYVLGEDGRTPAACPDLLTWARGYEDALGRLRSDGEFVPQPGDGWARVARTQVIEAVEVSTVFLGLDHQWGQGPPLLFETMVFGGAMDEYQERYSTWPEAEAGHRQMVEQVKAALAGPAVVPEPERVQ